MNEPVPLRLATWNLNHWRQPLLPVDTRRAAWEYLSTAIGAQVALVQEAVPPLELDRDRAVYGEIAGHRNWGSAVVALDPVVSIEPLRSVRVPFSRRHHLLANTHPGSMAVARLTVPGIEPITLVSIYGVLDPSPVSTMLRVIADLVPLFDSPHGARVILGGDLNVSSATRDPKNLARAEAVFAAIRALGLVEAKSLVADPPTSSPECWCGSGGTCDHLPTFGAGELDERAVAIVDGQDDARLATDLAIRERQPEDDIVRWFEGTSASTRSAATKSSASRRISRTGSDTRSWPTRHRLAMPGSL